MKKSNKEIVKISQTRIKIRFRKYLFLLFTGILFISWLVVLLIITNKINWKIFILIIIVSVIIILILSRPPPAEPITARFEGPREIYQPLPKSQPKRAQGGIINKKPAIMNY